MVAIVLVPFLWPGREGEVGSLAEDENKLVKEVLASHPRGNLPVSGATHVAPVPRLRDRYLPTLRFAQGRL